MGKYYTPSIEEFRVGFEYEYKNKYIKDAEYEKYVVAYLNEDFIRKNIIRDKCKNIRVKYLDKSDIESFGFEKSPDEPEEWFWNYKGDFDIQLYFNDKIENLDRGIGISIYNDSLVFSGHIKNKSELEILLKQLGIISNEEY